jgi:hypothetical protein
MDQPLLDSPSMGNFRGMFNEDFRSLVLEIETIACGEIFLSKGICFCSLGLNLAEGRLATIRGV